MTSNEKKYQSKNPLQRHLIKNFFKNLSNFTKGVEGDTLLDVGCGEGYQLEVVLKTKNFESSAIDPSQDALRILSKKLPRVKTSVGVAEKLPYKDASFDLVTCCEVLEHIKDYPKAIKEIKRVGRRYLIFSVPDEPLFSIANFLRGKNLKRWGSDPEHINLWSFRSFSNLINKDFEIIKAQKSFPWTMVLAKKK